MTNLFKTIRFTTFAVAFIFSTIVLGLSANLAKHFLPLHRDYLIFSLVASALTMVVLILLSLRSQPRVDLVFTFILAAVWVAMGGYSTDVIGHVECDSLRGSIPAGKNTTYSAGGYCRQTKVVQSFSWANFVLFAVMFLTMLHLALRAHARGYKNIWASSVSDLGWFDEAKDGRQNMQQYYPVNQSGGASASYTYPNVTSFGNSQPVYQLPGHSVVITNGPNGQQITQVPVAQAPTVNSMGQA